MSTNANTIKVKEDLKNTISNHIEDLMKSRKTISKTTDEILNEISKDIITVDFKMLAFPELDKYNMLLSIISEGKELSKSQNEEFEALKFNLSKFSPNKNHYLVICIEQLLKLTQLKELGLCKKNGNIFLYNGTFWSEIDKERFQSFLGEVALKMGVEKFKGKIHTFKDELHKQFMSEAYLPYAKEKNNSILINLLNGTYEINDNNSVRFRCKWKECFL
jgi:putative DNA primase/helicase